MKLYFAGVESYWRDVIASAAKNVLVSYTAKLGGEKVRKMHGAGKAIFIDSGAFSANTRGVGIDIGLYCDYIQALSPYIDVYANLDVIGDANATMRNQQYMERRGLRPLPVFHYGSDLGVLRELITEYPYVALGGMVPLARQREELAGFLSRCFSITGDKAKIHGFGITSPWVLKRFPFYSVDSTAWLAGSMRSRIYCFTGGQLKTYRVNTGRDIVASGGHAMQYSDVVAGRKRYHQRAQNNFSEWQKYADWLTDLWAQRGVSWDD